MQIWSTDAILGSAALPPGFAYATIGPGSIEDLVLVGGKLLRVGTVVPLDNQALAVQAPRATPSFGTSSRVELHLWKACEHPIAGPRAPYLAPTVITAYANGADATYIAQLTVPFKGRRACRFSLSWSQASTVVNFGYIVHATVYSPQGGQGGLGNGSPTAELDGRTLLVTAAQIVNATKPAAHMFTVGGFESEEAIDQLVLYTTKPAAGTVLSLTIDAEAWGDRGLG